MECAAQALQKVFFGDVKEFQEVGPDPSAEDDLSLQGLAALVLGYIPFVDEILCQLWSHRMNCPDPGPWSCSRIEQGGQGQGA